MIYYGCDYYPEQWPESRWGEDARLMQEAGFNVVRIGEFAWAKMEPTEGHYDWTWLDRAIGILADQGQKVVLGTPTAAEHNPSHVLDFYRFSSDSVRDYQQLQIDILRAQAPSQFVTHNFMLLESRELDFYDLAAPLDFASWDNYHFYGATPAIIAATHDIYWGMKQRSHWVMEQQVSNVNWAPYNPTFRPGEVGLKVWQSVAHGTDGVVYFRWRAATLGAELYHSGLLDHGARPTRGYTEAQEIGQALPKLTPLLRDSIPQAEVALLHDYPSRWSLDLQPHNQDLADDGTFRHAFLEPYKALWARNVPARVLPLHGDDDLSAYKIVIAPAINLLSRETADWLAAYVQGGGTLIATARTGFKDESGQVPGPPPGHLADILGVTVEEFDSLPPDRVNQVRFVEGPSGAVEVALWFEVLAPTTAHPLAIYQADYYAGRPAATVRKVGQGRAIYVGVLAGADFYGLLFDWLLPLVQVEPLLDTPPGVEAAARVGPAGRVLFLLNHSDAPATVALPDRYADALTGEPVAQELRLGPRKVRILQE